MRRFLRYIFCLITVAVAAVSVVRGQSSYPVYVSVQVVPPAGIYLTDYYSGARDRLIVTLVNRDNQQPVVNVRLRVTIRNSSVFELRSREELYYPMLTLESGVPLRLTSMDLQPYLAADRVTMNGYLGNGRLPNGMTEFRVQALDYTTGRVLSEVGVGRVWLESKQPPQLTQPSRNDLLSFSNPQHIRFSWMPRHQGLAQTSYEFVIKELPDNGVPPQTAFTYGPEIYRTEIRQTTFDYGVMEPPLEPGKRYGWQVRAKAIDGVDEVGMFENQGLSEISWFELSDNCPEVTQIKATAGFRKIDVTWYHHPDQNAFVVQWRPKTQSGMYEWESATVFENAFTIERLQEGWTYECRVGALCIRDTPVFGQAHEVTLPDKNEERLKNCGKVPVVDLSNQEPNEELQVGDMVTIGGDFPMRIDEVTSLGNGWYSGKGGLVFPWIFDVAVNVEFARLRVNTDNVQIDGEVETSYDEGEGSIGNTNELDYGGSTLEQGGVQFANNVEVDFTVPDMPQVEYNEESGKLTITDENGGNPQTIDVPKNDGKSAFPMEITDAEGNRYQIDLPTDDDQLTSVDIPLAKDSTANLSIVQVAINNIIDIKKEIRTIQTYDLDTTNTSLIHVANIVNTYLLKFYSLDQNSIPPNIVITDDNSKYGEYNNKTNTVTFTSKLLKQIDGVDMYLYTVAHELAHYDQARSYNSSFEETRPILAQYYEFIRNISNYPDQEKSKRLAADKGAQIAERAYNRETYAEIRAREATNLLTNLLDHEIYTLKQNSNTLTVEEIGKLQKLETMLTNFTPTKDQIIKLLTIP